MRNMLTILWMLFGGATAVATSSVDLETVAYQHLSKLGFRGQSFGLEQETDLHQLYILTFAAGTEEFPCHIGVVVDKATQDIVMGDGDSELILSFPYSDTFQDSNKKIYQFCAD